MDTKVKVKITAKRKDNSGFKLGDCHTLIRDIPDNSIQFIYFNPPFGTTKNEWDTPLNYDLLFPEFWRILKPDGTIMIHCSVPFNYRLIRHPSSKDLKYSYYWKKRNTTNYLNSSFQPLRRVEEILVYYRGRPKFRVVANEGYEVSLTDKHPTTYYGKHKRFQAKGKKGQPTDFVDYVSTTGNGVGGDFSRPDEMLEDMIKRYTDEQDIVLDITCGDKRSRAVAHRLNRGWIGFDIRDISPESSDVLAP